MLIRCDDGRGCEGVKDAAEEKEHGYECQQECEAGLYEAKGSWVDGALHVQQCVPEPGMTNARGFAPIGQVDNFKIKFFFCLRALRLWRLAARFHTGLYHAVGGGSSLSPRTYSLRASEERLAPWDRPQFRVSFHTRGRLS